MTEEPQTQLEQPEVVDADDYKHAGGELVVRDPGDRHDAILTLDRHVENEILDEWQSRALKVMLYELPLDGGQQVDLSYQGVNEGIRLLNYMGGQRIRIRPDVLHVETETIDGEEYVVATVMAENEANGYAQFGTATEPRYMKLTPAKQKKYREKGKPVREDGTIFDLFARTKAINKAQRNALKTQIPEQMRQTMIAMFKNDPDRVKVLRVGAGAESAEELPPPLTDDRANELRDRARALYSEIKEHAPGGLAIGYPPAKFHNGLARSEWSHERLEEFCAALEQALEKAKEAGQS